VRGLREHHESTWKSLGDLDRDGLTRLLSRVGSTPVAPIAVTVGGRMGGRSCELLLKLEGTNPGGSVKDRTALGLVRALRAGGALGPDSTLVESTSGNLGVALAFVSRAYGYRFHAVVDPYVSPANLEMLRRLEACVDMVYAPDENGNYLQARLRRVSELCAASPHYVWTNQYGSPANPLAHYTTTAPETDVQVGPGLQAVVVAVSTGGTLAGISRYFRQRRPEVLVVAADAVGSVALGGNPGKRLLTGIGSSQRSQFVPAGSYDELVFVDDRMAVAALRTVRRRTGIAIGGSGGAVVAAAASVARRHRLTRIACICADDGRKYDRTLYDERWLHEHGLEDWPDAVPFEHVDSYETIGG
jgi:2,3-diaminopropionate biosynthesis protein SbnA